MNADTGENTFSRRISLAFITEVSIKVLWEEKEIEVYTRSVQI